MLKQCKYFLPVILSSLLILFIINMNKGADYDVKLHIENERESGISSLASFDTERKHITWSDIDYNAIPLLESEDGHVLFRNDDWSEHFKIHFKWDKKRSSVNQNANMRGEWANPENGLVYLYYQEWQGHRYRGTLDYVGFLIRTKILLVDMELKNLVEAREAGKNEVVLTIVEHRVYIYRSGSIYTRDWDDWDNMNELAEIEYTGLNQVSLDFKITNEGIELKYATGMDTIWVPYLERTQ